MKETIQPGSLYVVSTPIGNLDDITLRAINILSSVDIVAAEDTRKTKFLLDHFSISKPLRSYYSYNESRRIPELITELKQQKSIAVVTDAGTPGISDPVFLLVRTSIENGIRVIPIPGASAVLAALVAGGLPMDKFVFEGFLPVKKGRKTRFEELKSETRTIVVYESPFRVERTLEDILTYFGERRVVLARELTKKFEEIKRGNVSDILGQIKSTTLKGEFVILIEGVR